MSDEGSAPVAAPAEVDGKVDNNNTATSEDPQVEKLKIDGPDAEEPKPASTEEKELAEPESAESEPVKEKTEGNCTNYAPSTEATEKSTEKPTEKPADDVEMADAPAADSASKEEKPESSADATAAATPKAKTPARRKSTAGDKKKLNKKGSKAAILHIDAKPGDHYFIKLKGFPQWPCIICDEDMLPHALISTRPVSAMRDDGTYREDFADGGKNAPNRTFPIMYLATNEFGWVSNKDLNDLDPEKVMEQVKPAMRKDLQLAHQLASEHHDLDYYKGVLQQFQEELLQKQKAAEAKAAAAATPKSKKKAKATADEDVEMEDVDEAPKKDKKRKNTDDAETPQRSESVKKPKIKLTNNSTPKANGAKSAKSGGEAKSAKKAKKTKEDSEERVQTPKEPEMTAEDRFDRKKKEVLFLRHKLQKGLLTRDQQPKEEEMKMMSDYLTKLESFPDLEVEIIRLTKINKVLKAMLKLDSIPKEDEFKFKPRSQELLDKWNRILASDDGPASAAPEETNGVNGHKTEKASAKEEASSVANGIEKADTEEPEAPKKESKAEELNTEAKDVEETKDEAPKNEEATSSEEKADPTKDEVSTDEKPKDKESKASEAVDVAA